MFLLLGRRVFALNLKLWKNMGTLSGCSIIKFLVVSLLRNCLEQFLFKLSQSLVGGHFHGTFWKLLWKPTCHSHSPHFSSLEAFMEKEILSTFQWEIIFIDGPDQLALLLWLQI